MAKRGESGYREIQKQKRYSITLRSAHTMIHHHIVITTVSTVSTVWQSESEMLFRNMFCTLFSILNHCPVLLPGRFKVHALAAPLICVKRSAVIIVAI